MNGAHRSHMRAQSGVVLFIAMILLLVLSLLGMVTAHSAIAENKMAGSERNRQLARIATASALSEARSRITRAATAVSTDQVCTQLSCVVRDAAAPADAFSFMQAHSAKSAATAFHMDLAKLAGSDATARLATNAIYVIEDLGADTPDEMQEGRKARHFFRISASSSGGISQVTDADEIVIAVAQ